MDRFCKFLSLFIFLTAVIPLTLIYGKEQQIAKQLAQIEAYAINFLTIFLLGFLLSSFLKSNFKIKLDLANNWVRRNYIAVCCTISFTLLLLIQFFVFERRVDNVDTVAQLFQAKLFLQGTFYSALPKFPEFFYAMNIIEMPQGFISQYPPGHPLLLASGHFFNLEWLVPVICSTLTVLFCSLSYRRVLQSNEAILSSFLLSVCPFFLFLGGSMMNHATALTFISIFAWLMIRYWQEEKSGLLFWAGLAISFAFIIRPLCAVTSAVVFGLLVLKTLISRREIKGIAFGIFAALPFLALHFINNYYASGDFLTPGFIKLWGASHGLGFHESPFGEDYGILEAMRNLITSFYLLNKFFYETPIPVFSFIALYFLIAKTKKIDKILLLMSVAYPSAYFFYWHSDGFLGPRFYFNSLIFIIPLLAKSILGLYAVFKDYSEIKLSKNFKIVPLAYFQVALCFCLIFVLLIGWPKRFLTYQNQLPSFKLNPLAIAEKQGIKEGIIFVPVSWGNRIIAKFRAADISASLVEKAYRNVDTCIMHHIIEDFRAGRATVREVEERLLSEIELKRELLKVKLPDVQGDPTLKLDPRLKLSAACQQELRIDNKDFTVFAPYFADNDPSFAGKIIIAIDFHRENKLLTELHPNKKVYKLVSGKIIPYE